MNEKLYWTEATVDEVLVMDIAQRQRIKLIDNYDGSTTRAIAVDPTTRYRDYSYFLTHNCQENPARYNTYTRSYI